MNYCKKCGESAPENHDLCWCCEHEQKLTRDETNCSDDACPIPELDGDTYEIRVG